MSKPSSRVGDGLLSESTQFTYHFHHSRPFCQPRPCDHLNTTPPHTLDYRLSSLVQVVQHRLITFAPPCAQEPTQASEVPHPRSAKSCTQHATQDDHLALNSVENRVFREELAVEDCSLHVLEIGLMPAPGGHNFR